MDFAMDRMTRHALLGSGSYGQVWLASVVSSRPRTGGDVVDDNDDDDTHDNNDNDDGTIHETDVFALKVQPKYELLLSGHAERFLAERNILASLRSPFVMRLLYACQDDRRLYMMTPLLQGGELDSLIPMDGFSEVEAKFYAAGILEGLAHMHSKHIIHRDVKGKNVLLDRSGYPCLIDLGFSKYVPDDNNSKTFTFCGSPLLTAPEIILYKGHDKGVDYWSWAVTVYRMVTGRYPFFVEGMDELTLYKRICRGTFELDGFVSMEFRFLMVSVLYPDPKQRLGSRAYGWDDIFACPWFANDPSFDLRSLRKRTVKPPWIPPLTDSMLDPSQFHSDYSSFDDWMDDAKCPEIPSDRQSIFASFGPQTNSVGKRVYYS
ncbi:serine/threonine protein kinase [Nitzschia inconspicua]|uniref:Serine/threonine protein kinase n=1 Tax=Nitzschia inconspicua TaxID=303405 RepID=A0A9K3LHV2_9STRA|nr:serine/threonine protein kinase [Nitzschia inconspicua]